MYYNQKYNSLNIRNLDDYYLNHILHRDINEYLHNYISDLNFCSVKTLNFDYYNRTENISFTIKKSDDFLNEFYYGLRYSLNRLFREIFYDILISKSSVNKETIELSKRKLKIKNLLNNSNDDFNQYIINNIIDNIYSDTKVLYFGHNNLIADIYHKYLNPYISSLGIHISDELIQNFKIQNLTIHYLPLKALFDNMIFLTNNTFIDFFLNENTFDFSFKETYNRNSLYPISKEYPMSYETQIEFNLTLNLNYIPRMEIFNILKINDK